MSDLFDLTGKVALITGSTRGIGRGVAQAFADAGASLVISSENAADVAATESSFVERGYLAHGIVCDVSDALAVEALVHDTLAEFGGVDVLVCNAGITGQSGDWSLDDFDRVMAINLRSMVTLTNSAMPHLAERKGSAILMSSISGVRGNSRINAYALAKAGVAQLARNLAVQWGPQGVRTNAISPGLIHTELTAPMLANAAFMEKRMQLTPLRRMGEVEEVAGAALFLASKAGGFVNGHNLVVDGGTVVTDGG